MSLTLGSLFDGSGGFPLAARMCGIEPVWASEIEPYPIRVTKKNFPNMKHYGDITKMNGAEIEPVDIITFGSPCQDLSTAGLRKGMKHADKGDDETTRSGLFIEAIRIIKEMRNGTSNEFPRWIIWENVFGAFSSNNGEDFWTVLKEIYGITQKEFCIPRLETWPKSGEILGDGCSLAWRTMDAQYWGVPQMRRRIFLVADFRGYSAEKILFEREGLSWNTQKMQTQRQETSPGTGASTPFTIQERHGKPGGGKGILIQEDKASTLDCPNSQRVVTPFCPQAYREIMDHTLKESDCSGPLRAGRGGDVTLIVDKGHTSNNDATYCLSNTGFFTNATKDVAGTLSEGDSHNAPIVYSTLPKTAVKKVAAVNTLDQRGGDPNCNQGGTLIYCLHNGVIEATVYENHAQDSRYRGPLDAVMGINSKMGTGGGNVPLVAEKKAYRKVSRAKDKDDVTTWAETEKTNSLNTFDMGESRTNELIIDKTYGVIEKTVPVYSTGHDFRSASFTPNIADPLTHCDYKDPPVVYCMHKNPTPTSKLYKNKAGALVATDYKEPPTVISFDPGACRYLGCAFEDVSKTLAMGTCPGWHDGVAIKKDATYSVRRLTPLECCRLQGFPDDWCDGVEGSDSDQYKMWGNGVALPVVYYIMYGIAEVGKEIKDGTSDM